MTYRTELEKRLKLLDLQSPPITNSDEISSNRAKVGAFPMINARPPSKITPAFLNTKESNVIYLELKNMQKGEPNTHNRQTKSDDEYQYSCDILGIFE